MQMKGNFYYRNKEKRNKQRLLKRKKKTKHGKTNHLKVAISQEKNAGCVCEKQKREGMGDGGSGLVSERGLLDGW